MISYKDIPKVADSYRKTFELDIGYIVRNHDTEILIEDYLEAPIVVKMFLMPNTNFDGLHYYIYEAIRGNLLYDTNGKLLKRESASKLNVNVDNHYLKTMKHTNVM